MAQKCFDQRDIDVDQDDVNGIQYCDPTANHQNIHFKEKVFYVEYKLSINFFPYFQTKIWPNFRQKMSYLLPQFLKLVPAILE